MHRRSRHHGPRHLRLTNASADWARQRTGPFELIGFDLLAEERAGRAGVGAVKVVAGEGQRAAFSRAHADDVGALDQAGRRDGNVG
jgi:hypothetical protein